MATKLQIANRALLEIGNSNIQSLTENTGVARIVSSALEGSIEEIQGLYDWPILRRSIALSPSVEYEIIDTEFTNAFELPDNVGNILSVADTSGRARLGAVDTRYGTSAYRLEDGHILCNLDKVFLHYSIQVPDVTEFPPYLTSLLVAHLASRIVAAIKGEANDRNMLDQKFERQLRRSKVLASRESPPKQLIQDSTSQFITAHQGYGEV